MPNLFDNLRNIGILFREIHEATELSSNKTTINFNINYTEHYHKNIYNDSLRDMDELETNAYQLLHENNESKNNTYNCFFTLWCVWSKRESSIPITIHLL